MVALIETLPQALQQRDRLQIDIETCSEGGGKLRVIACIEEPLLIAKILWHVHQHEELTAPWRERRPDSKRKHSI